MDITQIKANFQEHSLSNGLYTPVKDKQEPKNIGQFTIGEKIGEGTFGKVKLGTHIITGEKVYSIT